VSGAGERRRAVHEVRGEGRAETKNPKLVLSRFLFSPPRTTMTKTKLKLKTISNRKGQITDEMLFGKAKGPKP